jgi:hypothetical protein
MRRVILVTSHDEARASARAYWLSREPRERLAAVEVLGDAG